MDDDGNGIDFRRQWRGVYSQLLCYGAMMSMGFREGIVKLKREKWEFKGASG